MQATDYPLLEPGLPPYEPRGCQRGISASWYLYSPIRVKYPYIRGALLDLWREARSAARRSGRGLGVARRATPRSARAIQQARGKGGFRRAEWDEVLGDRSPPPTLYTARKCGPDRVIGFSPIPAMSHVSLCGGLALPPAASAA